MSAPLPFPSLSRGGSTDSKHASDGMKIDIPHSGKGTKTTSNPLDHTTSSNKQQQQQQQHHSQSNALHHEKDQHHHSRGSTAPPEALVSAPARGSSMQNPTWHHRPRQPAPSSDSYFPHSSHSRDSGSTGNLDAASSSTMGPPSQLQPPRTPGSGRGHSRQTSAQGMPPSAMPPSQQVTPGSAGRRSSQQMQLSLSTGGRGIDEYNDGAPHGFDPYAHHGPPSPSTLTDIILGIHSTLYGGKRTPEEVREMVYRFYDRDAVFESPLLAAVGREQIANQFIMAFSLPGVDVTSELRDVICSDFEFDGTRAGIIDQTLSVTLLPSLFGSSSSSSPGKSGSQSAGHPHPSHAGHDFFDAMHRAQGGSSTPAYTLQSAITPHPFANYSQSHTPAGAGSTFSRNPASQGHSPTTPFSLSNMWGSFGTSRPHTPGPQSHPSYIRPFSTTQPGQKPGTPPSVNGEFDGHGEDQSSEQMGNSSTTVMGDDDLGNGVHHMVSAQPPLRMPENAVAPHWTSQGLGRMSLRAFLWGVFHPRAVLKHLCTINLRLMSRLEFNDAGQIVRHEDTWGVREMIEGTVPFASLIYALERRIVGHICSFAIGRGFRLSSALTRHAIGSESDEKYHRHPSRYGSQEGHVSHGEYGMNPPDANEAAHALLLGYNRNAQMRSMARSRASSPTRSRFFGHGPFTTMNTGSAHSSRSRARSIMGGPASAGPARAASSDNLVGISAAAASGFGERERGSTHGGETLPPDSGARYRTGSRRITTSTSSAPMANVHDGAWQNSDWSHASYDGGSTGWDHSNKARAPDRDDY